MEALSHGNWPVLKSLELDRCNLNSSSIVHLTAGNWPQLESLWLGCNPLTASDIAQLATGNWPHLQHLDLAGVFNNVVTDKDGKVTAEQSASEQLDRAFMYHISTGAWPQMERMKLSRCRLNFANIRSLMLCHWPRLAYLDLSQQQLGNDSFALLRESEWPMLQWLDLTDTGIGPTAMSYLVLAKWPVLKTLNLSSNAPHLTVDAVTILAQKQWACLEKLSLRGNLLGTHEGVVQLLQGKCIWPKLRFLDVCCADLDATVVSVLRSAKLPLLEFFRTASEQLQPAGDQ